jgi:PAS domain S-box-containing protein
MRKYLYYQLIVFLAISFLGVILTGYYLSESTHSLKFIQTASESLSLRSELLRKVSELDKKKEAQPRIIEELSEIVARCKECHAKDEHLEGIKKIEALLEQFKETLAKETLSSKEIDVLHDISEEISLSGTKLINLTTTNAIIRIKGAQILLGGMLFILLILLLFSALLILRMAKRNIDNTIKATRKIAEGETVDIEDFRDEFKVIGEAFESLQKQLRIREEKLRNWAENWQNSFDAIEEAMAVCDAEGRVIVANRKFREEFGEDVEGLKIVDTLCIKYIDRSKCPLIKTLETAQPQSEVLEKNGRFIYISTYPIKGRDGNSIGAVWIGKDITKERELEERALQSEKMVALGELIAGIAHELNNPLSVVVGYSEMLTTVELPEDVREKIKRIYNSGIRAANIIKRLIGISRKKPPETVPLNINQIVENVIELLAYEFSSEGIEIKKELQSQSLVQGDSTQLTQVVLNLIKNAHDAVLETERPHWIKIKTYDKDDYVFLEISDSGPGIPPENLHRIFEPFFTTKEVGKGTGLGLSITYTIVKAHGGEIIASNQPEGGAIFSVQLPILKET